MIQLTLIIISIIIYLLYYYLVKPFNYWKEKGINYVQPIPFFGNVFANILQKHSIAEVVKSIYDKFKDQRYCGMYQFTKPVLLINDPDLIKVITIKDFDYFTDHVNYSREDVDNMWSKTVLAMTGESWRNLRGTLSPAFTGRKMRFMFTFVNECAENYVAFYLKQNQDFIKLELKDSFIRVTNDAIASCAFGVKCDSLKDRENLFYAATRKIFNFSGFRQSIFIIFNTFPKLMKFLGLKIFGDEMCQFFRGVIDESIKMREDKRIIRPDMVNVLLQSRNGKLNEDSNNEFVSTSEYSFGMRTNNVQLTNETITAQVLIFLFGGSDTASQALSFLSYELAINNDIQVKLREEINSTWKECKGNLTYETLIGMTYLDMVISEVLRKWPPFPFLDRRCTKDYTIKAARPDEKDYHVKRNDFIYIPLFGIQRDPKYYPNPESFDPERFSVENRSKLVPYSYMPFGSGPRICIGTRFALLANKAMIFHLIRNFEIVPIEKTSRPIVISKNELNISSHHGFWLGLKRLSS